MDDKKRLNQPYYTESVDNNQSNLSDKKEDFNNTNLYQGSEAFPPRGSFINVPAELLFGPNVKILDLVIDDKDDNIASDLYKKTKNI